MSPRKRQPAPTDHATMLDLALEDLQRTRRKVASMLSRHPDRAHAALDLLLFNVGCWEVRWLNVATDTATNASPGVVPLADEDGISTLDLENAVAMSERAKELVDSPADGGRTGRSHREVSGQVGHGRAAM